MFINLFNVELKCVFKTSLYWIIFGKLILVINQKDWQLNTGTIYVQVSPRIANFQKIIVAE
jgi:hypothetical protein